MSSKKVDVKLFQLMSQAISTAVRNPMILMPYVTIVFVQFCVVEVLYFAPRYPLSIFFVPVIERFKGEIFLHYPLNFSFIPQFYHSIQNFIFIFVSSFMVAVSSYVVFTINNGKRIKFSRALRDTIGRYVHIIFAAAVALGLFYILQHFYGMAVDRAEQIRSTDGKFYMLKIAVIRGAPFMYLVSSMFVTALLAYVMPIIAIERRNVFMAFALNFKYLFKSFFMVCGVVIVAALFYVPFLLIRGNIAAIASSEVPEMHLVALLLSIVAVALIDMVIYTSVTINYLLHKEAS